VNLCARFRDVFEHKLTLGGVCRCDHIRQFPIPVQRQRSLVEREAAELGLTVVVRQTDSEAELLGWVHAAADAKEPVVLNAGALTHTSVALRDACAELTAPLIEVHISNVHTREEFRHRSYLSGVATGVIVGLGVQGYLLAPRYLAGRD
jgi:3-dehydroquinate dehydratase-2